MGESMCRRLVFATHALREKLVLWDAGLDDRVVELRGSTHSRICRMTGW
jgi:hypothetical protein